MKIRTFATITSTFVGAALMGYGQAQDQQQRTDSTTGAATAGEAAGTTGQATDATRQGEGVSDTTAGARTQQGQAVGEGAPRMKSNRELAERFNNWHDAEETKVQFDDLPEKARSILESLSAEGRLDKNEISRMKKDNEEVYHAKVSRDGDEELHAFVQKDGTVAMTKEKAKYDSAPQEIRSALHGKLGDRSEPEEFYRVMVEQQPSYIAKIKEGNESKMILISQKGETTELKSKDKDKERKND